MSPVPSALTNDELLGMVDELREKFSEEANEIARRYVEELVARRVYPSHWPPPSVWDRVRYWGARWHEYEEPHHCPHCNADLCDREWGPPGKRELGLSNGDSIHTWKCPDCGETWPRGGPRQGGVFRASNVEVKR